MKYGIPVLLILGCWIGRSTAAPIDCAPSGNLRFVCGAEHPEDLAHIPDTPWLIASGFSNGAGLKLVDTRNSTLERWYTGAAGQIRPDRRRYPNCPAAPDAPVFNAHGINLRHEKGREYTLYVVNHGGRESIEVFSVSAADNKPSLQWTGCVVLPEGMVANSVAAFGDGTILTTILTKPGTSITDFVKGQRTGAVLQWSVGSKQFTPVPGTDLPGNNGLETSPDDKEFYVVAFGWHAIVAYTRDHSEQPRGQAIAPGFMPDNVHWDNGHLLAAGMQLDEPACGGLRKIVEGRADDMRCHRGFTVAELDPQSLTFHTVAYSEPNAAFNGVSAAVVLGDELWLGSYQADRIAHRPLSVTGTPVVSNEPVIATTSGQMVGKRLGSGVQAYLGVRYAEPPVGDLRWRAPHPIHWDGVVVADRKGPECIQVLRPHNINHYFGEEASGEDCLFLNIWSPSDTSPTSALPVIVFIYGGGGTIGSSGMAVYDGENVARHGAVFVSLNYRVGALGFMAHPELTQEQGGHSGNYGYLDQNAALRWIRDNIAAFGGDPARVLLSGQSFGAGSVAAHIFSPLSQGLFSSAALWSACNFTTTGPDLQAAEQIGLELQKRLGAGSLRQLRNVPADKILAQQAESQVGTSVQGIRTPPLIDGYFTVDTKPALLHARRFYRVPIMVNSNTDDLDAASSPLTKARTLEEFRATANRIYGSNVDPFLKLFPVAKDSEVYDVSHTAAREGGMLAASRACAQLQAEAGGPAAYISLFAHKHPYAPGVALADQNPLTIGAYHTADVPYWLQTFDAFNLLRKTRDWQREDEALSEAMLTSLIAFASAGSPNTPSSKWPAWSARDEQYAELSDTVVTRHLAVKRMDWLAAHPAIAVSTPPPVVPRD